MTALRAPAAFINAVLHIPDTLAVLGTRLANLRAFFARVLVVIRVDEHEMRRRAAHLGAGQHEPEVVGLGVLAPLSRQWFIAEPRQTE